MGPELHRLDVPAPKLFGMHMTPRGIGVAALACVVLVAMGVVLDLRLLSVCAGFGLMATLLVGYLAWMTHITWRKGPRVFSLRDDALVVTLGDGREEVLLFEKVSGLHTIDQKSFPFFLQIHHAGENHQYTVHHIPPKDLERFLAELRAHLGSGSA